MTITEFLLARIAEDEKTTYALHPYECEPGCCAPAGWVGHECLICDTGVEYGGTVEAITEIAEKHAEKVHHRSRLLAECKAKREIVAWECRYRSAVEKRGHSWAHYATGNLRSLASVYADHEDYDPAWA